MELTIGTPTQAVISKNAALEIARQYSSKLANQAASIQFYLLTRKNMSSEFFVPEAIAANPHIQEKGINKLPVWIVSFEGLHIPRTQGIELTEDNLVIDGVTGKILYGFRYR